LLLFLFLIKFWLKGLTALMIALKNDHFEIVKFLIENNADVNIQNDVFF
jgi:ankyrin repeat protein